MFLLLVHTFSLFAQKDKTVIDTLLIRNDSLVADTTLMHIRRPSGNAIDQKVTYSASDYIKRDLVNKKIILINSAVVNYGEIEIKADSIVFNMSTNLLFAAGRKDSTGMTTGTPEFKEGSNEFQASELTYNFKTHKALIRNIVTKQEDGLLHSDFTKLLEDGTSNIAKSTYSTCDADTPHFYINLPKARVFPGEKIISGPGNLVLEGIPLPLAIPFGYFPINTKKAASGILMPGIGQETKRGYSLTEGGYYFAVSDYFDLSLTGSIYSNGTWLGTVQSKYNRLYKYSGNLLFSYAKNVSGHKGLSDYSEATNYKLSWTFSQDAKASPGSRFSASVNMSSSGYEKSNSYNVADHTTTQKQSSISYSKSWEGTPFNLSASMNHNQNAKTGIINLNLPKVSFNVGRIYPLKSKKSTGSSKWYQELQFQYSAFLDNQIATVDSVLFTKEIWKDMRNGFRHEAPLSLQIRPFRNFSISPALTYSGVLFTQKIKKEWREDVDTIVVDTLKGAFYGQAIKPSFSASFNPQIFGTFEFGPESRIQAIRHVIKPSIGFSYVPYFSGFSSVMYDSVQTNVAGNKSIYSIYDGNIYLPPSLSSRSGSISFGLINILESKVFSRNDTTGKPNKVKIIDNFGISTSYDIFAKSDEQKWSPVSMQVATTLLNKINISARSSFSLYGIDSLGKSINTFAFAQDRKLMRLNSFTTGFTFSLSDLLKGKKGTDNSGAPSGRSDEDTKPGNNMPGKGSLPKVGEEVDENGYAHFDMPWSLNINYSLNYSKPALKSSISQTLSASGNVTFTKKMSMTYTTGYDFDKKQITMTQLGIKRDLHCWEMNLRWVPNGSMKGWNFTIRVKASVLGDLKYERRKDYHDDY